LRRFARHASSDVYGLGRRVAHRLPHEHRALDDATLVQKVQSILFRDPSIPKGMISVNAEDGYVYLRGEVESVELIGKIGESALEIDGVRGVKNLLHTPSARPTTQGIR
jgi:osmotically-inducible protein OsmY